MSASVERTCPCERAQRIRLGPTVDTREGTCPAAGCGLVVPLATHLLSPNGGLCGCLACAHPELYTRKDFPPALGISIVVVAAALAPFTAYYSSLVGAALLDTLLYRFAPDVVVCYLCKAEHRGFAAAPRHPRFDRTIEERLRYGDQAVMGSPMRSEGTADAPEPEH